MNKHFRRRLECPACAGSRPRSLLIRRYDEPSLRAALENFYATVGQLDYACLHGATYELQRCEDCHLVYQQFVPDEFILGTLYEEWINPQKAFARYHVTVTPVRRLQIARDVGLSLSLVAAKEKPIRALDYGCGWGEWAIMMAAFGVDSWGTELSPTRRDYCAERGIRLVADANLPEGGFDFINADQVFEHLPDPRGTLQMLTRVLGRNGVMRIAVPNGWRIERRLPDFDRELMAPRLGRVNPVAPLEHLNCFRTRSLVALATGCGLRRVVPSWRLLQSTFHLPSGWRARAKAMVRPFYLRSAWSTQLYFSR